MEGVIRFIVASAKRPPIRHAIPRLASWWRGSIQRTRALRDISDCELGIIPKDRHAPKFRVDPTDPDASSARNELNVGCPVFS